MEGSSRPTPQGESGDKVWVPRWDRTAPLGDPLAPPRGPLGLGGLPLAEILSLSIPRSSGPRRAFALAAQQGMHHVSAAEGRRGARLAVAWGAVGSGVQACAACRSEQQ